MLPRPSLSSLFPYTTLFRSLIFIFLLLLLLFLLLFSLILFLFVLLFRILLLVFFMFLFFFSLLFLVFCDRKSTRLNSSHVAISYAVFCLKTRNRETSRGLLV